MINAKEAQKITATVGKPFAAIDEVLDKEVTKRAEQGLNKVYYEGLKAQCPRNYSFGEWANMVRNHYTELGYEVQMYADNNRFYLLW